MIEASFENRYDADALEAKMAKFKFAKKPNPSENGGGKNSDWFKQLGQVAKPVEEPGSGSKLHKMKFGLTKEDEIQI